MAKKQNEIRTIEVDEQFRTCPSCGYADGFHNMFENTSDSNLLKWYFICPQCSSTFDIGLTVARKQKPA
ncbi:MAG: hypothetical protein ACYSUC_05485 [Planctomycetota bacterium]|jgi:predicted RNA-binding Zn-ribbon protein involved in translation (DUF1610 family)